MCWQHEPVLPELLRYRSDGCCATMKNGSITICQSRAQCALSEPCSEPSKTARKDNRASDGRSPCSFTAARRICVRFNSYSVSICIKIAAESHLKLATYSHFKVAIMQCFWQPIVASSEWTQIPSLLRRIFLSTTSTQKLAVFMQSVHTPR